MSWHPNDLLVDTDLTAYEPTVLTQFAQTNWQTLRTKVFEDWLFPILRVRGFDPEKLRTRYEPDRVFGLTASAYSDLTSAAISTVADDIDLATVITTPATDALYVGSTSQFRGLFFDLLEAVSSAAGVLSAAYWNGNWESLTVTDSTIQVTGKSFSAGGSVTWTLPTDWTTRALNNSDRNLYWAKVTLSASPTGAKAGQIGVIHSSVLRAPVTLRTLQLIFRQAATATDGPWKEKADFYQTESEVALERAMAICGGEFDTDASGLVSTDETGQTAGDSGGVAEFLLERR